MSEEPKCPICAHLNPRLTRDPEALIVGAASLGWALGVPIVQAACCAAHKQSWNQALRRCAAIIVPGLLPPPLERPS